MRILHFFLIPTFSVCIAVSAVSAETIGEKERERIKLNEKYDRHKLREKTDFVVDCSKEFLIEPGDRHAIGEYAVANVPPTVKMRIHPDLEPEYFTDLTDDSEAYMAAWANWARVGRSEDNRFYFAASDHRGMGCHINIYEYCPGRDLEHRVLEFGKVVGWTEKTLTDGKIHGHMRIMPDGTLWAMSHFGVRPDSSWWANGYRGSWLISYNIYTHKAKNWGVPLVGQAVPCFNIDTKRGRLFGTGDLNKTVLCWDCINKKVRYAGNPPEGWKMCACAMFLDEATGKFWSTDQSDDRCRFISFDPEFNRFERYDVSPPENPYNKGLRHLRGYINSPAMDGWYYCSTYNPSYMLFRFKPDGPDGPVVESLGPTWDKGMDVHQLTSGPTGRYVYYYPRDDKAPLVQYDVTTGEKKALCWLHEYYFKKYGYWIGSSYGMEISKDGSFLVVNMNGSFKGRGEWYGHPSLFVIEIPEEERPLN